MLSDVISRFATHAVDGSPNGYTVTRVPLPMYGLNGLLVVPAFDVVGFDAGSFNAGGETMFPLVACVQPYSGRGLEVLPQGVSVNDVRVIDSTIALQVNPPDLISIAGDNYAVFRSDGPNNHPDGSVRYTSYAARQTVPG